MCSSPISPLLALLLSRECMLVLRIRLLSFLTTPGRSSVDNASYGELGTIVFRKNMPAKTIVVAPIASKSRYPEVSSGNMKAENVVQKKALKPKALNGNAVAVPLCRGQFVAHTFKAALKAVQLAIPVKSEKKQSAGMLMLPAPLSYAVCRGKYPHANPITPTNTPHRGPRESIKIPPGIPMAYIPMLPKLPIRLACVAVNCNLSANCGSHAEKA